MGARRTCPRAGLRRCRVKPAEQALVDRHAAPHVIVGGVFQQAVTPGIDSAGDRRFALGAGRRSILRAGLGGGVRATHRGDLAAEKGGGVMVARQPGRRRRPPEIGGGRRAGQLLETRLGIGEAALIIGQARARPGDRAVDIGQVRFGGNALLDA